MAHPIEILVVGDVHGMWDETDRAFVESGSQDVVVFVGDLGDDDIEIVGRVAALRCTKAVVLGNHDAWSTRKGRLDRARQALDLLGDAQLAYGALPIADRRAVLVGGRPFSWGGDWERFAKVYDGLFGLPTVEDSAARIVAAAQAHAGIPVVLVGHNGPTGLGDGPGDIWGRDFRMPYRDWGDVDMRLALDALRSAGRDVPLLVAGHMHDRLQTGGARTRTAREEGVLHVNAAVVPRHRSTEGGVLRHYVRVVLDGCRVASAEDLWIDDRQQVVERRPLVDADDGRPTANS